MTASLTGRKSPVKQKRLLVLKTSSFQIQELFENLNFKDAEILVVHSSLFSLGIIEDGLEGFHEQLMRYKSDKTTVIVPTFTWSFRRNQIFDIRNTPADPMIGVYSEYFRKLPNSFRGDCPQFSFAAIGPEGEEIVTRVSKGCFGIGSVFEKLFVKNAYTLSIGVSYSRGLTGFVHIEKLAQAPYRVELPLTGLSINKNGEKFTDSAVHFAINENDFKALKMDRESIGKKMEQKQIVKTVDIGGNQHLLINNFDWLDFVSNEMALNPLCMVKSHG